MLHGSEMWCGDPRLVPFKASSDTQIYEIQRHRLLRGARRQVVPGARTARACARSDRSTLTLPPQVKQFEESLSKDPTLRSIEQMWNAIPLREVVPIDWAEIARALRTVIRRRR